jgi:very-short-patch-repair endonuclease
MSQLEDTLEWQLRAAGVDGWTREHRFCTRRWRFDFCWPLDMLAAEVDGGEWTRGRHNRGAGMAADNEKINEATLLGWRVFRFTGEQVQNGYALDTVIRALKKERDIHR